MQKKGHGFILELWLVTRFYGRGARSYRAQLSSRALLGLLGLHTLSSCVHATNGGHTLLLSPPHNLHTIE